MNRHLRPAQRRLPSWPSERPDLQRHPQLAALGALYAAVVAAAHALDAAHPDHMVLDSDSECIVTGLLDALDDLLAYLDHYHERLPRIDPMTVGTPPRVSVPESWTEDQAHAVLDFLRHAADAVWAGHESPLVAPYATALTTDPDDLPF